MKKLTLRGISLILLLAIVFSISSPTFASTRYSSNMTNNMETQDDIDSARTAYYSLSPKAKAIFDVSLVNDPEMLKFHQTYVDANFVVPFINVQTRATTDPMTVLMAQLSGLGLPSAVLYSLKTMGAGMVAAIADGPLPIGDILLAAATASMVIVVAANWNTVAPVWSQVVNAFKITFTTSVQNVISAFSTLKSDVNTQFRENFYNSASDAIDACDKNKQNHILASKHNWNLVFKGPNGPNWGNVAPLLLRVLKQGQETSEGGNQYLRTLIYQGETVVVRFIKGVDGLVQYISTAWIE